MRDKIIAIVNRYLVHGTLAHGYADDILALPELVGMPRKAELWDKVKGLECENCPLEEDCYADGNDHRRCPVNKIIDAIEGDNK